jgi:hypothetical protein
VVCVLSTISVIAYLVVPFAFTSGCLFGGHWFFLGGGGGYILLSGFLNAIVDFSHGFINSGNGV